MSVRWAGRAAGLKRATSMAMRERLMAARVLHAAERPGDWGAAPTAGYYGTGTLRLRDGVDLFYRRWRAAEAGAPVVVLSHGLGAHTGWFLDMGDALRALGLTVYADDHRGFGRSGGPRGHVPDYRVYVADTREMLDEVRRQQPEAPIFLLGHSMGALLALYAAVADARRAEPRLSGLVLMNPWIRDRTKVRPLTALGVLLGGLRGSTRRFPVADESKAMTCNAEAAAMLAGDTYWVRAESVTLLYQVALKMRSGGLARARQVRIPALVTQSEGDQVVVAEASRQCFDALAAADKAWKTYPGYCHDCELEEDRSALDDDIARWVLGHAAPAAHADGQ